MKLSVGFADGGGQVNGCRSVPKRVRDEVRQDPPEDGRVGIQLQTGVDRDGDLRALVWRDLGERLLDELMDTPPFTPYRHGLCAESRKVQELFDQRGQSLRLLGQRRFECGFVLRAEAVVSRLERERAAEDGRGRSSELMRRNRDERIAHAVELHQTVVKLRTLDPERRAFRGSLEEVCLVRREVARHERPHVDHAEDASASKQRGAEQRLEPLLAEDGVEDVRVVDVLDRDDFALRSETPREALSNRDANAGFDLLLETRGRAGDDLASSVVEQENRARVGFEDLAHPDHELVEQVGRREMRQRDVGDHLNSTEFVGKRSLAVVEPAMLDRKRCPIGDELEQLGLLLGESTRRQCPDVNDADDSAADEQRRAQERLDPLLPQERIEHIGVIDVLDDDRSPLGGDLAREAETHRDACPAFHGLLEPARCARDELVGRLVEQKERCSVAPKRLADAGEQLVEQLVELEVCQCGIRDRLDAPELILVSPPRDVHFVGSPSENCQA